MFNLLPIEVLIDDKIFSVYGGLSPDLKNIEQLYEIPHPTDYLIQIYYVIFCGMIQVLKLILGEKIKEAFLLFFSEKNKKFLYNNSLVLIYRAYQFVEDGYEFFWDRSLVTVFSSVYCCGGYQNCAVMMNVDLNLICSFKVLNTLSEIDVIIVSSLIIRIQIIYIIINHLFRIIIER